MEPHSSELTKESRGRMQNRLGRTQISASSFSKQGYISLADLWFVVSTVMTYTLFVRLHQLDLTSCKLCIS